MSSERILSVRDVAKGFDLPCSPLDRVLRGFSFGLVGRTKRHQALDGVSFEVGRGETVALMGVNGAGKSTLLQMIAGTMAPSAGRIEVTGRVAALLQLGAGFSFDFTGRENAVLNARLLGADEETARALLPWIVEFSGIGEAIDRPVRYYSSGMFVRLAFSVAAAVRPDIMIIDEALGVGDAAFQAKCYRYLKNDLADVTKLLVSHDSALIGALAERAIVLRAGKVAYDGALAGGIEVYERAFDETFPEDPTAGRSSGGEAYALDRAEVLVDGAARRQVLPGQRVRLDIRVRSAAAAASTGFLSLVVDDAFGQKIFSNDHLSRSGGVFDLAPGEGTVSVELVWPELRRGQYVVRAALETMPLGASGMGQPTGASTHVTLTCVAPYGAEAILTLPTRIACRPSAALAEA